MGDSLHSGGERRTCMVAGSWEVGKKCPCGGDSNGRGIAHAVVTVQGSCNGGPGEPMWSQQHVVCTVCGLRFTSCAACGP